MSEIIPETFAKAWKVFVFNKVKIITFKIHTFPLDSSMSTSKFDVSDGLLTSGMYGGVAKQKQQH